MLAIVCRLPQKEDGKWVKKPTARQPVIVSLLLNWVEDSIMAFNRFWPISVTAGSHPVQGSSDVHLRQLE